MKKILLFIALVITSITGFASEKGLLFNVTGTPDSFTVTTAASHYYPSAGMKIITPGVSVVSGCTQNAKGYCQFGVSNTSPTAITTSGGGKNLQIELCLDATTAYSCQRYTVSQIFAYIVSGSSSATPYVGLCSVNPSTGLIVSCKNAAADYGIDGVLATAFGLEGLVIDEARKIAYLSSFGGTQNLYECKVNDRGLFTSCSISVVVTPSGYAGSYGMLTTNSSATMAYVVNNNGSGPITVLACPITAGIISGDCTSTGATISSTAVQIALNSTNTVAYVGAYGDNYVTVCDISADGFTFSNCVNKTGDNGSISFNAPAGVVLNNTGSLLYVGEYGGTNVYACSTTPNGSASYFNNCFLAASGLGSLNGIALDGSNKTAYLTNFASVYICPINADGTFGTCTINSDITEPVNVVISN